MVQTIRVNSSGSPIIGSGGGGGPSYVPVTASATIQTFTLTNTSATTASPVLTKVPLFFAKTAVTSAQVPQVTAQSGGGTITVQFDEVRTWSDGSWKSCVMCIRDTNTIAASGSRLYDVAAVTGSRNNSGVFTLTGGSANTDVAADSDWKGDMSAHSQPTQTDTANHSFSLNTAAGTATRVTKIRSGPVCDGWVVKQTLVANDEIIATYYVDAFNDGSNTTNGNIACAMKLGLLFWDQASKDRHDYTLTFKEGVTTKDTYSTLQHHYHSEWITVRLANDPESGRMHWQDESKMPTLMHIPDFNYLMQHLFLPPLKLSAKASVTVTPAGSSTYTPCSNQGHRANIDGTGGYIGRGVIDGFTAHYIYKQTSAALRLARVQALTGLHLPWQYVSKNNRNRSSIASDAYNNFSGETADVSFTPISLILDPLADYDFQAEGMPAPTHGYNGSAASATHKAGWVGPSGGTGSWSNYATGASHAPQIAHAMYLIEGERYLLDAAIQDWTGCIHKTHGNQYRGRGQAMFTDGGAWRGVNWPITIQQRGGSYFGDEKTNYRDFGIMTAKAAYAAGLVPDNDVSKPYLVALAQQDANTMGNLMTALPTAARDLGVVVEAVRAERPWMRAMQAQGFRAFGTLLENTVYQDAASVTEKWGANVVTYGSKYMLNAYAGAHHLKGYDNFNTTDNPYVTPANIITEVISCSVDAGTNVVTVNHPKGCAWSADDRVVFVDYTDSTIGVSLPGGYTQGDLLYVISPSGNTFKVSTTSGGGELDLTTTGTYYIAIQYQDDSATAGDGGRSTPNADDYAPMWVQAIIMGHLAGNADCSQAIVDELETWIAAVDINGSSGLGLTWYSEDPV